MKEVEEYLRQNVAQEKDSFEFFFLLISTDRIYEEHFAFF